MKKIKLLVRDKFFELDSTILFKFKYFKKILSDIYEKSSTESRNIVDLTNKNIDICPNEFREIMKHAKDPTYKIKKKHQILLNKLGLINEFDILIDKFYKNADYVGKINNNNILFNFFKIIDKNSIASLKSDNNTLILNILNDNNTCFVHSKIVLDEFRGSINKPIYITHENLNLINKLSPNSPIIIYLKNNKLYLYTKTNNIDIKWNLYLDNTQDYFEEPPEFNYSIGFKSPVGTLLHIAKINKNIEFNISDKNIKIICGTFNANIKEKCNESFSIIFNTKYLINFLKNFYIKDNIKVYLKKNHPLKIIHKNENKLTEFYLSN